MIVGKGREESFKHREYKYENPGHVLRAEKSLVVGVAVGGCVE